MNLAPSISLASFALRAVSRPAKGNWLALTAPTVQLLPSGDALIDELEALAKRVVIRIDSPSNPRELTRAIREAQDVLIVVTSLERFSCVEWQALDAMRSGLEATSTVVLVVSENQATLLASCAPNLASWLIGGIWSLDIEAQQLTDTDRSERLGELREMSGMSDEEVIRRAETGLLEREPYLAEWLILLGRSDLVDGR